MSTAPDSTPSALRPARPTGPWHEAMAYSSPGALAAALTERVAAAAAAGDSVTAVLADEVRWRLRHALGAAAGGVRFLDPAAVHTVPGFTTAARWARGCRQAAVSGARTLIVVQQLLTEPGAGPEYWMRLCLGIEVAGAELPWTVLCAFPDATEGWDRVRPTHPVLSTGCGATPNPHYRAPLDVLREHPPAPRPDIGPPAAELEFLASDLGELRRLTAAVAGRAGLDPDRVSDAVLAVNELASNSIEHGPSAGRLRLWPDGTPALLAEVADRGQLTEPFPGMALPPVNGARGRGLWLASELCDVMEVWTDDGTVVRVSWLR